MGLIAEPVQGIDGRRLHAAVLVFQAQAEQLQGRGVFDAAQGHAGGEAHRGMGVAHGFEEVNDALVTGHFAEGFEGLSADQGTVRIAGPGFEAQQGLLAQLQFVDGGYAGCLAAGDRDQQGAGIPCGPA